LRFTRAPIGSNDGADALADQVAAGVAVGFFAGLGTSAASSELLREQVRATLVLWQSQLRADGAFRAARSHPLAARMVSQVVQLLCEVDDYAEPLILADVSRHLDQLARHPQRACWLEGAAIVALADGAMLLRRAELVGIARDRLRRLLARQSEEGWFPERGGADIGRLSLTIDALARVYHHYNWDELTEPLTDALRFLRHFVTPTGLVVACGAGLGTGCLSPHGLELLAPTHPDAHALALILRHRYARLVQTPDPSWSAGTALRFGSAALLAARCGGAILADCEPPRPHEPMTRFNHAELIVVDASNYRAVVSTRHGGALWVWWKRTNTVTQDAGLCVIFATHVRTSGRAERNHKTAVEGTTITCGGILRRLPGAESRSMLHRWLRRVLRPRRDDAQPHPLLGRAKPLTDAQHRALLHDYFRREISLHDDRVEVRDEIICRTKCQTVVCGSPVSANPELESDATPLEQHQDAPLNLSGGKHAVISRTYRAGTLEAYRRRGLD